jgi:hypothetical protein
MVIYDGVVPEEARQLTCQVIYNTINHIIWTILVYGLNKTVIFHIEIMWEGKCYIRKRTNIELPACENTKVCCVAKYNRNLILILRGNNFGVGSD